MIKQGAILIEVLLATVIASIVSAVLFSSFYQINKYSVVVDDVTMMASKATLLYQQLEHDLSGVFMPVAAQVQDEQQKQAAQPTVPGAKLPAQPAQPQEKIKPVDKVFYATLKNKQFELLTFVTNNPMQVYWSDKAGQAKPRVARVVYRLVPDTQNKKQFILMRQEGTDLYFANYKPENKKIREYPMIDGIKSLSVVYMVKVEPKDKNEKPTYKTVDQWKDQTAEKKTPSKTAASDQNKEKEAAPKVFPDLVKVAVELVDTRGQRATSYELIVPLAVHGQVTPQPAAQLPPPPAAPVPQPAQQQTPQSPVQPQGIIIQGTGPATPQQIDAVDNVINRFFKRNR